jgi:hypothetical protein
MRLAVLRFHRRPKSEQSIAANGTRYGSATIAEIRANGFLVLQGFGRIEGILLQGTTPGTGQEIFLTSPNSGVSFEFETMKKTTDAQENFIFENVPAGTFALVRLIKTSPRSWRHSHSTPVVITAGQTTQIVLGGTDATLQARVRFETAPVDTEYRLNTELSTMRPNILEGLNQEQRKAYVASAEWKEQMKNQRNYAAIMNA